MAKVTLAEHHDMIKAVPGIKTRISKICDQRLPREIGRTSPRIEKNARQKLAVVSLPRGDVAQFVRAGSARRRRNWLAGLIGLELRNPSGTNSI
jgi:hypothetical protein